MLVPLKFITHKVDFTIHTLSPKKTFYCISTFFVQMYLLYSIFQTNVDVDLNV